MSPDPILTTLIYTVLLSVTNAQTVQVLPEVSGYVGEEVTLLCQIVQEKVDITQVQWDFQASEAPGLTLLVSNKDYGIDITGTYKDRLMIKENSLVIKSVVAADAGSYTCTLSTFPSGSLSKITKLIVSDQKPLTAGLVVLIVLSVILLLGITAATVYVIVLRRRKSFTENISIDPQTEKRALSRTSKVIKEDVQTEVVYSEVKRQKSDQKRVRMEDEHVTYSEVNIRRKTPHDVIYTQVMRL